MKESGDGYMGCMAQFSLLVCIFENLHDEKLKKKGSHTEGEKKRKEERKEEKKQIKESNQRALSHAAIKVHAAVKWRS